MTTATPSWWFRDREFLGSVCNTRLIIDSRLAAEIQAGESARFRLPAGLRVVSVQGDGICRGEAPKQVVHVQNGRPRITGSPWTPA